MNESIVVALLDVVVCPTVLVFVLLASDSESPSSILYIFTAVLGSFPVALSLTSVPLMSAVNDISGLLPVNISLNDVIKASDPLCTTRHSIFCNSVLLELFALM